LLFSISQACPSTNEQGCRGGRRGCGAGSAGSAREGGVAVAVALLDQVELGAGVRTFPVQSGRASYDLWVPRTVSHLLTSAFVVGQARRPPAMADQHDRSL
jgi:hypothetical protein